MTVVQTKVLVARLNRYTSMQCSLGLVHAYIAGSHQIADCTRPYHEAEGLPSVNPKALKHDTRQR